MSQNNDSVFIKKLADEILTNGQAYQNLHKLCKEIGPRLSGSANAQKAVDDMFQVLKLSGADTVYLLPCTVSHWVRGKKETGYVQDASGNRRPLKLCALGNSVGTGKDGVKAEIVEVNSFAALDRLGKTVINGKIVFYNFPMNPTYISTFRAYGESGVARRKGAAQAAKYGAIGVMVRSLASNIDDYPHTGAMRYEDSLPKIPAVAISTSDAEWLSSSLKNNKKMDAFFQTNCEKLADVPSYDVIGEIRGTELANEIITVGGHLDSWDLAEGAQDDGAGVVQSIEILRAMKAAGIKPKRTVRVVLFMDEENSGGGSQAYLDYAKKSGEKQTFALESDGGGFTPRGFSLEMENEQATKIQSWKNLFYPYGVYDIKPGGSGSDIGPLKELKVPLAGLMPDSQRYFDLHHAANDTFESVSKRELHLGAANMAALVWLVSEYGL